MSPAEQTRYTPEDLLTMPDGDRFELVDGILVARDPSSLASWIGGQVLSGLAAFCEIHHAGWVWPAGATYQCFPHAPETVPKASVSFIRTGRLPGERLPRGHIRIHPDLAVEVISPNDLFEEVEGKKEDYLRAGVPVVWIVSPQHRTVHIYRADSSPTLLREGNELIGEGPLADFRCPVRDLFPPTPRPAGPAG
jgi:Uma2 family endonuclease